MQTRFYIQVELFEDAWFDYVDCSPLSYETRERAEFYLGRMRGKRPELNLRIIEEC